MSFVQPIPLSLPITLEAFQVAYSFQSQQSNQEKSYQIYRNTIAVYMVNLYLESLEIGTNLNGSCSFNPLIQSLMNVADLEVNNRGKLECIPVYSDSKSIHIPLETWSDRIGCVVVELDEEATEVKILGFVEEALTEEVFRNQLQCISELGSYLKIPKTKPKTQALVSLSKWFENIFPNGWEKTKEVINQPELTLSFRNSSQVSANNVVKAAKLIDLGIELGHQSVALLVALTPEEKEKVGVCIQLHPGSEDNYLPSNIKLAMLSAAGDNIQEVQARNQDNYIQLKRFKSNLGNLFSLQITFDNLTWEERFII
ncbi:MAG: DUF1822 family protein [Cyanobacteria bacterium P01_A01_bin.84]